MVPGLDSHLRQELHLAAAARRPLRFHRSRFHQRIVHREIFGRSTESMDRVREGYFEVFLMGQSNRSTGSSTNVLEYNAEHVNGVPRDCAKVDQLFTDVG